MQRLLNFESQTGKKIAFVRKYSTTRRVNATVKYFGGAFVFLFLTIVLFLLPDTSKALLAKMCRIGDFKGVVTSRLNFWLKGYVSR